MAATAAPALPSSASWGASSVPSLRGRHGELGGASAHERVLLRSTQWRTSPSQDVGCRTVIFAESRGRGRGGSAKDGVSTRCMTVSGANIRVRRPVGKFQAETETASDSGVPHEHNIGENSSQDETPGWDVDTSSTNTPTGHHGNLSESVIDSPNTQLQSADQDQDQDPGTESGVEWGELVGTRKVEPWTPDPSEFEPECKEIDDLVKSMRRILFNLENKLGDRLSVEDDKAVQAVLAYHPNFSKKVGCGVAYIKVDISPGFPEHRCFWLVRTDGSETDFSFHKCLKMKILKEFPFFVDRYDALYCLKHKRQWYATSS